MAKSPLWESLKPLRRHQRDPALEALRAIPVFADINNRGLRLVKNMCHTRHYKEGEHVFRSGEPGVGMYMIMEGSVEIYREDEDFYREYAVLYAGDFFGEIALLDDMARTASVRARSYSTMLGFYRPDLMTLLQRNPPLAGTILMNIARLIGRRLVNTNRELEKLHLRVQQQGERRSVLDRIAKPRTSPE